MGKTTDAGVANAVATSERIKFTPSYAAKTLVCIAAFLGGMLYFNFVANRLANNYLILVVPQSQTIPWLIQFVAAILWFAVASGIVTVLVRPWWLVILVWLLAAATFPLVVGSNTMTWITAAVFAVVMTAFLAYVIKALKNQINFSAHPLVDMKLLILSLIAALICVAFILGYQKDSVRRNYTLAPEIKNAAVEMFYGYAKGQVEAQAKAAKAKPEQIKAALDVARKTAVTTMDGLEKGLAPQKQWLPIVLGVLLFITLQTLMLVLGFVPIILVRILFVLLKATGFAHVTSEMREVHHLTLTSSN